MLKNVELTKKTTARLYLINTFGPWLKYSVSSPPIYSPFNYIAYYSKSSGGGRFLSISAKPQIHLIPACKVDTPSFGPAQLLLFQVWLTARPR